MCVRAWMAQWVVLGLALAAGWGGASAIAHPRSRATIAAQESPHDDIHEGQRSGDYAPKIVHARDLASSAKEPTCDELKAMWRFSKRQARTPEIINDLTTYRDPFTYNEWAYMTEPPVQATPRYRGSSSSRNSLSKEADRSPVYGRVIHKVPAGRAPAAGRLRGYDEVVQLYGVLSDRDGTTRKLSDGVLRIPGGGARLPPPPSQSGRFNHLKNVIRTERARELQMQRMMEELEARAAALKDITGTTRSREREGRRRNHSHNKMIGDPPQYQDVEYPVSDEPTGRQQLPRGRQYLDPEHRRHKYESFADQNPFLDMRDRRSDEEDYYQDADIAFVPIPTAELNPADFQNYFYNRESY